SILDPGQEFALTGAAGENIVVNGVPTQPGALAGTNTFRYSFAGQFDTGKLTVTFLAGSWRDDAGNGGVGSAQAVAVITQARSFFIELSGGVELRLADLLDQPLMKADAKVTLEIDSARHVITLSFSGQLSIYKLGTVGATAGRFILDLSYTLSDSPQFWGVATLQTNFKALEPYGLFILGSGTLQ